MSKHWSDERRLTVDVLVENQAAISFWRAIGYNDYALRLEITAPVGKERCPEVSRNLAEFDRYG